jgi:electron transport complex protein RnfG
VERGRGIRILGLGFRAAFAALAMATGGSPQLAEAKVFISLPEALAQAFPASRECQVKPETHYLTPEQLKKAGELAGSPIASGLVVRHVAVCAGKPAGRAYTDTHKVRTHPESVLVVIDPSGKVVRVETLSFDEPLEYRPRNEWYATFQGARLDGELELKHKIPFVTGASLTSRATTQAARRALALDQVLAR